MANKENMVEVFKSNIKKCDEYIAEINAKITKLHDEKMKYVEKKIINIRELKEWKN